MNASVETYDSIVMSAKTIADDGPQTEGERKTREDLAAAYQLCALFGWDDLIYTHISAKVPGPHHHFLVNPLGLSFDEITASNLIKIDLDGNIIGNNEGGYQPNSAGFVIHGGIHAARENARCIMHLHTEAQMALSMLKDGLLPLNQHSIRFHNRVGYHDYEGIAFSFEERTRLVADLGNNAALILRNHGTITVGESVAQAFVEMYYLEKSAKAQLLAQGTGLPIVTLSKEMVELTASQWKGALTSGLEWPSLLRRLDRAGSSYKR